MRTLTSILTLFLFIGTIQASSGQDHFGQRVSADYTAAYAPDVGQTYSHLTGTYGMYQVNGDHTFEQSVSVIGYKGSPYLSGYGSWTYSSGVWQRISLSITPLFDYQSYDQHFLSGKYILSVPFGSTGFHADNVVGSKYFFDDNLNISYAPFVYYKWKHSSSGLFFDLGPRAYLNTYQRYDPDYWSPRLFYQLGAGARLGMYGDPLTFVLDSFVGTSRERLRMKNGWTRNNNLYLSFRTSYSFDSGFDLYGSASWASSRNLNSPVEFSELIGKLGLAYNF